MKNLNNKGVTLTTLVIAIVVLIILASISIDYAKDVLDKSALESVKTNMLLIEAKVKLYAEEYHFDGDASKLKGTKVADSTDNSINTFNSNNGNAYSEYYYLNRNTLSEMGLTIKEGNYLVNYDYENIEIVFVEGVTISGETYYKLSEIEKL